MRTFNNALRFDLAFEFRHGFYHAYGLVTLLYVAVLRLIPEIIRDPAAVAIIYSDPSVLGFFFMAGIFLMERQQGVLTPLLVTPLGVDGYILSKAVSLSLLSVASGTVIALAGHGVSIDYLMLVPGIAGGSVLFTLVGVALVSRSRTLSEFLAYGPFILIVPSLSLLPFLGIWVSVVPLLMPGGFYAALVAGALGLPVPGNWLLTGFIGLLWTVGAAWWAKAAFLKNAVQKL